jgi:hypothetical protein
VGYVLAFASAALVVALAILPTAWISTLATLLTQPHSGGHRCLLCGMTTACLRLRDGDPAGALRANPGSLLLFLGLVVYPLAVALMWSFTTHRPPAPCGARADPSQSHR